MGNALKKVADYLPSLIAGVILVAIVFAAMTGFSPAYDSVCSTQKGGNCLRDWLSALGGWATLIAAVPTLFYLDRQIRAVTQANRDAAWIALRKNRSLALKTLGECRRLSSIADGILYTWNSQVGRVPGTPRAAGIQHLDITQKIIDKGIFEAFEKEIDIPAQGSIEAVSGHVSQFLGDFKQLTEELSSDQYVIAEQEMLVVARLAIDYCKSCTIAANDFLAEANLMMGVRPNEKE